MLILTRRVGETLKVGNDVDVTVLGVKGNQIRIGIKAPKNVAVHREEIFDRIKREAALAERADPAHDAAAAKQKTEGEVQEIAASSGGA